MTSNFKVFPDILLLKHCGEARISGPYLIGFKDWQNWLFWRLFTALAESPLWSFFIVFTPRIRLIAAPNIEVVATKTKAIYPLLEATIMRPLYPEFAAVLFPIISVNTFKSDVMTYQANPIGFGIQDLPSDLALDPPTPLITQILYPKSYSNRC